MHSYFIVLETMIWSIKRVHSTRHAVAVCTGLLNFQVFCKPHDIRVVVWNWLLWLCLYTETGNHNKWLYPKTLLLSFTRTSLVCSNFLFFFFKNVMLGIKLRALLMLSTHFSTKLHSQTPYQFLFWKWHWCGFYISLSSWNV